MAAPTANYARACTNFNINFDGTFASFTGANAINIAVNRSCRVIDALQVTAVDAGAAVSNTVATVVGATVTTIVTLSANTAAGDIERATAIGAGATAFTDALVASGTTLRYTAGNGTARHLCALTLIGSSIP